MRTNRLSVLQSAILFAAVLFGCKKVAFPNGASAGIIGSWEYQSNSGGFLGSGGSSRYTGNNWIECAANGCLIVYSSSKKEII